jgi:hypothetical protein
MCVGYGARRCVSSKTTRTIEHEEGRRTKRNDKKLEHRHGCHLEDSVEAWNVDEHRHKP